VKRFAQDDGFVRGLEIQLVGYAENTKISKKSQALGMTKERATLLQRVVAGPRRFSALCMGHRLARKRRISGAKALSFVELLRPD
jgi:hypothetical protein